MAKLSNIEVALEFLRAKKTKVKFNDMCKVVSKEKKVEASQKTSVMASLYSALVLDNRFALTPDGSWALKSNLKYEDVKKQYSKLGTETKRSTKGASTDDDTMSTITMTMETDMIDFTDVDFGDETEVDMTMSTTITMVEDSE